MKEPDKCKIGCGGHRDTKPNDCPDYKPKSDITKGTWEVRNNTGGDSDNFIASPHHSRWAIAIKISKDDANLIAEAGTVHNETGCTPRELLEQRDALLAACKKTLEVLESLTSDEYAKGGDGFIRALLAKTIKATEKK